MTREFDEGRTEQVPSHTIAFRVFVDRRGRQKRAQRLVKEKL
jgi:hypothetical protein